MFEKRQHPGVHADEPPVQKLNGSNFIVIPVTMQVSGDSLQLIAALLYVLIGE